jgi:hypothetical protein
VLSTTTFHMLELLGSGTWLLWTKVVLQSGAAELRCWLRLIYNLAKAMSLVFMPLVPVRLQRRSQCMWVMRAYALDALVII